MQIQIVCNHPTSFEVKASEASSTCKKVARCACAFFKTISSLVYTTLRFPFRYLGSKRWSAIGVILRAPYHLFASRKGEFFKDLFPSGSKFFFEKRLSKQEALEYLIYPCFGTGSQDGNQDFTRPFGYKIIEPTTLQLQDLKFDAYSNCYLHEGSGVKVTIYEKDNEVILAFGAKNSSKSLISEERFKKVVKNQTRIIKRNLLGIKDPSYREATAFVEKLLNHSKLKDKKVSLVGGCLGGSYAQYVGLKLNLKTVCTNSLAIGAGLQSEIGDEKLKNAGNYVTHLVIETDFVSDIGPLKPLDYLTSLIGIRTPGNFGRSFSVPSAYKSGALTHCCTVGSMMKHMGFHERTLPGDIKDVIEQREIPKGA